MIDFPPALAKTIIADMKLYFKAENEHEKDAIAVVTRSRLLEHMPAKSNLRLSEVKDLFRALRDQMDD